jgi:predicted transcriptional regulator
MEYAELGWQEAVILGSAKREGILEAVADGSRSAEEVAKELGASPRAVYALFSALVELGVLAEDRNRFRLLEEHEGLFWTEAIRTMLGAWSCTASS